MGYFSRTKNISIFYIYTKIQNSSSNNNFFSGERSPQVITFIPDIMYNIVIMHINYMLSRDVANIPLLHTGHYCVRMTKILILK